MFRITAFVLIRLLALAWVLILANVFDVMGPYAISVLVIASEATFGFLWAKAETTLTMCKPKREDPQFLIMLMLGTAIVEGALAWRLAGTFAVWVIMWRAVTSYVPFSAAEVISYQRKCRRK
jgi:hypothetical protein